jgi:hypothetical protein
VGQHVDHNLMRQIKAIIRVIAKITIGAGFYLVLISFARRLPSAAGIMLTFPALNGLALLFADRHSLPRVTGTMLILPLANAVFCFVSILAIKRSPMLVEDAALTYASLAALFFIWIALAALLRDVHVPERARTLFAAICTAGLLALTVLLGSPLSNDAPAHDNWFDFATANQDRIALFTVCLVIVAAYTERHWFQPSSRVLGVIGGLPLVTFIGLATTATDRTRPLHQRLASLHDMQMTVWLGPILAIWFIHLFSLYLADNRNGGPEYWWRQAPALLFAWSIGLIGVLALKFGCGFLLVFRH